MHNFNIYAHTYTEDYSKNDDTNLASQICKLTSMSQQKMLTLFQKDIKINTRFLEVI